MLIHDSAFPNCGIYNTERGVFVLLNLLRCDDNEIDRPGDTPHPLVDYSRDFACIVPAGLYHQKVKVAVRPGCSPCRGAEEENLFRMGCFNNPVDDFLDFALSEGGVFIIFSPDPGSFSSVLCRVVLLLVNSVRSMVSLSGIIIGFAYDPGGRAGDGVSVSRISGIIKEVSGKRSMTHPGDRRCDLM